MKREGIDGGEGGQSRTLRYSIFEGISFAVMAGFGDLFFAAFAIHYSAGNTAVALLATMPHLLGAFAQITGAHLTERYRIRRRLIIPMAAVHGFCYLPLFLLPFLFPSAAVPLIMLCVASIIFFASILVPAWTSMMGDVVPDDRRGQYFGTRARFILITILGANLTAGLILSRFDHHGHAGAGFAFIFTVAFLARMVSVRLLTRHDDPPYEPAPGTYFSFWQFIRAIPRSNFARFALYFALMVGATNISAPFFTVYMLRDLHWTYAQFTINAAMFLATQFVMVQWWGRIGDRYGNRVVLLATGVILSIVPVLWLFSVNYFYLLGVQVLAGVGWSGYTIAAQNYTYDAVTPHKRARIASYTSVLNGICAVIGSAVLGAWLANNLPASYRLGPWEITFLSSLPGVFLMSAVLRATVTIIMTPHFREVRRVDEPIHPAVLIIRLAGGQAVAGFLSHAVRRYRTRGGKGGERGEAEG